MAGNVVNLVFAGDSTSLERTFKNVGSGATSMAGELASAEGKSRSFGSAMDGVGSSVGGAEGKFMGTADLLDGLGGAFGLPTEGATGLFRAFGDLSGGFEVVSGLFSGGIGKIKEFGSAIAESSAVTKIWTGVQAAFNAVMALNPAILIGVAIVALAAALVLAYQKSETFRDIVQGAFHTVKEAAETVMGFIQDMPEKISSLGRRLVDIITWPYKTAFNLVSDVWNSTIGKVGFEVPSWVPGVGGKGWHFPEMPHFHQGGIVPGPRGAEVPIMAMAGETVIPAGAGGNVTIRIPVIIDGRVITEVVHNGLLAKQRRTPLGLAS